MEDLVVVTVMVIQLNIVGLTVAVLILEHNVATRLCSSIIAPLIPMRKSVIMQVIWFYMWIQMRLTLYFRTPAVAMLEIFISAIILQRYLKNQIRNRMGQSTRNAKLSLTLEFLAMHTRQLSVVVLLLNSTILSHQHQSKLTIPPLTTLYILIYVKKEIKNLGYAVELVT